MTGTRREQPSYQPPPGANAPAAAASGTSGQVEVEKGASDSARGLRVTAPELATIVAIAVAAAVVRFAYAWSGGPWDSDQGTELLAVWSAFTTGQLPTFGPAATSLGNLTFHHGALYYDLLLPVAWLSRGDPRAILAEIAAINSLMVPMLWWVARSIGGRTAGLIVALMVATSVDLVFFSSFIWNPDFVQTGAALSLLGAWQAWRSGRPCWWLAAAAGITLAIQSHETAAVLLLPLGAVFVLDLKRAKAGARRRVALWGAAGAALFVFTYLPLVFHELTSGFTEIRAIASYLSSPPGYVSVSPIARLVFAAIRIPAWPITGWPFYELRPGVMLALTLLMTLALAWSLMMLRTWRHHLTISGNEVPGEDERHGVAFVVGSVVLIVVALGLGLRAVSELNATMSEQYHTAADPFVLVATGVTIGAAWNAGRAGAAAGRYAGVTRRVRRAAVFVVVAAFVGFNAAHWPPVTTAGSWADAQAAAARIENDAAGSPIALVPLYTPKGADAYAYPLLRDGFGLVAPQDASTVVLLCDTAWITTGCGGYEEMDWLRYASEGRGLTLIDYFNAAPDKIMSVYRRMP